MGMHPHLSLGHFPPLLLALLHLPVTARELNLRQQVSSQPNRKSYSDFYKKNGCCGQGYPEARRCLATEGAVEAADGSIRLALRWHVHKGEPVLHLHPLHLASSTPVATGGQPKQAIHFTQTEPERETKRVCRIYQERGRMRYDGRKERQRATTCKSQDALLTRKSRL